MSIILVARSYHHLSMEQTHAQPIFNLDLSSETFFVTPHDAQRAIARLKSLSSDTKYVDIRTPDDKRAFGGFVSDGVVWYYVNGGDNVKFADVFEQGDNMFGHSRQSGVFTVMARPMSVACPPWALHGLIAASLLYTEGHIALEPEGEETTVET